MKIDCVLSASNMTEMYFDFIPLFIQSWKTLYPDIDVKIVLINDTIPDTLKEYESNIICFPPITNPTIPTSLIAQVIRDLYPALLKQYSNGILISDIDMMPMNNIYYTKPIENIPDDKFIIYRDVLLGGRQIAMCYNVATADTWSQIFNINSVEDVITRIKEYNKLHKTIWETDQIVLYSKVFEWNTKNKKNNMDKLVILKDTETGYERLDRIAFPEINKCLEKIKEKKYTDYHALRPYKKYKEINDLILENLKKQVEEQNNTNTL